MNYPLVTVLVVCYNHQGYVSEAINSVLSQTYPHVELIVVDDHSTDDSDKIIRGLQEQHGFVYIRNEKNIGLNNSITVGVNSANGEYISLLASDDYIAENKIDEQLKYLLATGKDGVYSTGFSVKGSTKEFIKINNVFNTGNKIKILDFLYQYDWGVPLQQSSLLKRELMVDLLDLRKEFKSDDWAFMKHTTLGMLMNHYSIIDCMKLILIRTIG
jgi:glycosyltransferase involved in cell wall biosynthesis